MGKRTPENVALAKQMLASGQTLSQIGAHFGIKSKSTVCYWVNESADKKGREQRSQYSYETGHKSKRKWINNNREKMRGYQRSTQSRARVNARYHHDPQFKLKSLLRRRINHAVEKNWKSGSAVQDLGCSIEFLKQHLESQFQEGMTWENHGEWHIDHKKPLASFDLTNREQLLEACHYTNLQPLWAADNIAKGNRCPHVESLCSGLLVA